MLPGTIRTPTRKHGRTPLGIIGNCLAMPLATADNGLWPCIPWAAHLACCAPAITTGKPPTHNKYLPGRQQMDVGAQGPTRAVCICPADRGGVAFEAGVQALHTSRVKPQGPSGVGAQLNTSRGRHGPRGGVGLGHGARRAHAAGGVVAHGTLQDIAEQQPASLTLGAMDWEQLQNNQFS